MLQIKLRVAKRKEPFKNPIVNSTFKHAYTHIYSFIHSFIHSYNIHAYINGKSIRITLEVSLFTRMPLEVPNFPSYPYAQKKTLYKVIIHSNLQALFTRIPL